MESKSYYPLDYQRALKNTFSETHLESCLKGSVPIFVFGPLMLPQVLKSVTDTESTVDMVANMTQASLLGHKLWVFDGADSPVVRPSAELGQSVDGFVVFALTPEQRTWVHEFEVENSKTLAHVQIEICLSDGGLRNIDAATFVWTGAMDGLVAARSRSWKIDAFLESEVYRNIARKYDSR